MRRFISKLLLSFFLVLCLIGMSVAVGWGMGDLYGYKARSVLHEWQRQGELPSIKEVSDALADAELALSWESANPEYIELKARILYYRALVNGLGDKELIDISDAKKLHLKAIELRPNWPYSWANLVLMKSYLQEFDEEYDLALSNALRFGPWEQSVHLTLTHSAAISWLSLTQKQKRSHAENIQRAIVRNRGQIGSILNAYNKRSPICAYLRRDVQQVRLCTP